MRNMNGDFFKIREYYVANPGASASEIQEALGVDRRKISKALSNARLQGSFAKIFNGNISQVVYDYMKKTGVHDLKTIASDLGVTPAKVRGAMFGIKKRHGAFPGATTAPKAKDGSTPFDDILTFIDSQGGLSNAKATIEMLKQFSETGNLGEIEETLESVEKLHRRLSGSIG